MAEERYTSRHTGQEIDDAVDAVANKADVTNIGGAKHLAMSQVPIVSLQSIEQVDDTNGENNKMWWSTDGGKLKYKQSGQIYVLADTPPYMLYYCGETIYKWNGNGFTAMSSGGGGGSSNYPPAGGIPATDLAGDIPASKLASAVQAMLDKANSAYQKPSTGIPSTDLAGGITNAQLAGSISYTKLAGSIPATKLASAVQTSLDKANTAYQKPSTGIPMTDLASAVQAAFGKVLNVKDNNSVSLWIGTQAEFEALTTYENNVLYLISASVPSQPEVLANPEPITILGLVTDPANKFNIIMNGRNITEIPSSSLRACIMVEISDRFPALPSDYIAHVDAQDSGTTEADFIRNDILTEYTEIGGVNIKAIIVRLLSTTNVTHFSSGILNPQKTIESWRETSFAWEWANGALTKVYDVSQIGDYLETNKYYLLTNFKKVSGSSDQSFSVAPIYRSDFDVIIVPNVWDVRTILPVTIFQSYFNVTNQWAGGMAIHGEYIVQFFTSGRVLVLSKNTLDVVASGAMYGATSNYSMHCNTISFSNVIPDGGSFPYLYISEWTSGSCNCHVETMAISGNSITMNRVQVINYNGSKFNTSLNWDWSVDAKTGYLWCYGYAASASDRYGAKVALKFNLPDPTSGNVTLTDRDILDEVAFTFEGAQQDVHIENDMMFCEFSYNGTGGYGGILMVNLKTKEIYRDYIISLEELAREPEGVCRDGSNLYVSTHAGENNFDLAIHVVSLLQSNFDKG